VENRHHHHGDQRDCQKHERGKKKSKPAYGNFWSTRNQFVRAGEAINFDQLGPTKRVDLMSSNTVEIKKAGDYEVTFILTVRIDDSFREADRVAVFLNNTVVPGFQTTFFTRSVGRDNTNPANDVVNLVGTAIIAVPAKAMLQLRNVGPNEIDIFGNNRQNGAALTIIKLG
jgi:hypothetical protein